jgi:Protein of unknown function (DUF2878)
MKFWLSLVGYQLVWFAAVIGAGKGLAWPGVAATLVYAACQLGSARHYRSDLSLMALAIMVGLLLDSTLIYTGLVHYAAPWPSAHIAPVWIVALWAAFSLTFTQSLAYLQTRLGVAALLGAVGGPLAYLSAARGWQALTFVAPNWRAVLCLSVGWALATPALAWFARRRTVTAPPSSMSVLESTP